MKYLQATMAMQFVEVGAGVRQLGTIGFCPAAVGPGQTVVVVSDELEVLSSVVTSTKPDGSGGFIYGLEDGSDATSLEVVGVIP